VVRQNTGPARVPATRQHRLGGEARRGVESYPLQWARPADLSVLQRDDVDAVPAPGDVRLRANAERARARATGNDEPTRLHAGT